MTRPFSPTAALVDGVIAAATIFRRFEKATKDCLVPLKIGYIPEFN